MLEFLLPWTSAHIARAEADLRVEAGHYPARLRYGFRAFTRRLRKRKIIESNESDSADFAS